MSRYKYSSQRKEVSTQGQALLGFRLEKYNGLNEQLEQMWSVKFNMVCTLGAFQQRRLFRRMLSWKQLKAEHTLFLYSYSNIYSLYTCVCVCEHEQEHVPIANIGTCSYTLSTH